jgi:hypothetical protein
MQAPDVLHVQDQPTNVCDDICKLLRAALAGSCVLLADIIGCQCAAYSGLHKLALSESNVCLCLLIVLRQTASIKTGSSLQRNVLPSKERYSDCSALAVMALHTHCCCDHNGRVGICEFVSEIFFTASIEGLVIKITLWRSIQLSSAVERPPGERNRALGQSHAC